MALFTFDEAAHEYRVDGVRYPSVTEIIRPLSADWLARIPHDVLERKRAFGVAVHKACEWDDDGELDDGATDPRVMGCVNAWRAFRRALNVQVIENETRLYHPTLLIAGTLDRFVRMDTNRTIGGRDFWLLDIKTSDEPHESYGVQLAGYLLLIEGQAEGRSEFGEMSRDGLIRRGTVHLFDDGTYKLHQFKNPNDEPAFRACLSLHHWKESCK